jgi:hypothetical protein
METPKVSESALGALISGRLEPGSLAPDEARPLLQLSRRHGLGSMALWTARQAGVDTTVPPWSDLAASLPPPHVGYLLRTSSHNAVQTALDAAGIPSIWLKGFALAHTVYPRPTLRPMGDLDVLVPFDQRREALAVLQAAGYNEEGPEPFAGYHDLLHHYGLRGDVRDLVMLELHFRLVGPGDRLLSREGLAWFWEQTRVVGYRDRQFTALAPEAQLLYLCAHAILHHCEASLSLRQCLDLHLLATRTPGLDWSLVLERAVGLRWTYAVERALGRAQEVFATPLPEGILAELAARRLEGEPIAHARRRPATNHWETLMENARLLRGRERWQLLVGTAFPSVEYIRYNYQARAAWTLPWYYLRRWAFFAGEAFKTARRRLAGSPSDN